MHNCECSASCVKAVSCCAGAGKLLSSSNKLTHPLPCAFSCTSCVHVFSMPCALRLRPCTCRRRVSQFVQFTVSLLRLLTLNLENIQHSPELPKIQKLVPEIRTTLLAMGRRLFLCVLCMRCYARLAKEENRRSSIPIFSRS